MATTKTHATGHQPYEGGPPRARYLGWDEREGAWKFLDLETGEEFHADIYAVTPGHYHISRKVYRKG